MTPEFSLAHLTLLESSPTEMINIAHGAGYDYVSLRLTPVSQNEQVFPMVSNRSFQKKIVSMLADTGVRLLDVELARLGATDQPEDYLAILEAAAILGAKHLICQVPDPDRLRAADKFAGLCELAKPFSLTIDLEFLPWTRTNELDDAASIVSQADSGNAGILVDILHFARSGSNLKQLRELPREWFNFVHLCDADAEVPDTDSGLIHTARHDRQFPGQGGINVEEIVSSLPHIPYSLEIPNTELHERLGGEEYARRALIAAREFFATRVDSSPNISQH